MARRDFAEVLASSGVNIVRDYINLYEFMWGSCSLCDGFEYVSAWEVIDGIFTPEFFSDTSVSLRDFTWRYGFDFPQPGSEIDLDLLVNLCEFIANLLERSLASHKLHSSYISAFNDELVLIDRIMDWVDYRRTEKNGFTVFVPRDIVAEAAAEVLPEPIAWQQLAYGHRSLKGDIEGKKTLLVQLGHELESKRDALRAVNPLLENRVLSVSTGWIYVMTTGPKAPKNAIPS